MSKFWRKALAIFAVLALCLFVFAACVPESEPDPPAPPPEEPTQEQINLENMTKFGGILAASLGQNPDEGFFIDLSTVLGFEFTEESKKQYDWKYGVSLKAGIFINDTEAMALEIKDKLASAEQIAAGEDVVLGLYNTSDGNLYLQIRQEKPEGISYLRYNFSDARVSTAIKSILLANGVNLDVVLNEIVVLPGADGKPGTSLGGLISTAMTMLAGVTDTVAIDGNDFLITTSYKKLYGFANGLVGLIPGMSGETLDTILPDGVKNALPEDISLNIRVKTDGKVITGVKLTDSKLDMKDDTQNGTFNLDADFSVAKTVPESFDVNAIVAANAELAAIEATKLLNLDASGKIELQQKAEDGTTAVVRNLSWKFKANVDVLKLVEKNFQLTDPAIEDNFLWFQLSLDGAPLLDLVWGPKQLGTTDLNVILDAPVLITLAAPGFEGSFGAAILRVSYPEYLVLPITDTALLGLINGSVGAVPDGTGSGEGGAETPAPAPSFDLKGIIDTITNVVKEITIDRDAGEMRINVQNLFTLFGLDDGTKGTINNIIGSADVARFFESTATYGNTAMNTYETLNADLLLGKDNTARAFSKENGNRPDFAALMKKVMETNDGYLKIYEDNAPEALYDAKTQLLTASDLNAMIGKGYIRYTGKDIEGTEWNSSAVSYGNNKTYYMEAKIVGYSGVDTSKTNVEQEITVYTEAVEPLGYFNAVSDLIKAAAKIDLSAMAFNSFKAKIVLGEIDSVDVNLFDPNAEGGNVVEKVYTVADVFDGKLNIEAKVNFKPSALYPEGSAALTRTVSYGADDSQKTENIAYIGKINTEYLKNADGKSVIASEENFTIEGMAFGKAFTKTVQVKAPESVKVQAKGDGDKFSFSVGDAPGEASQYVRFEYAYEDGTVVKDIRPFDASASDAAWVNADEMLDEAGKLKAVGTLNMTVTVNGEGKTIGIPVVSKLTAEFSGSLTATEPTNGFYSVSGKVILKGENFPEGVDRKLKVVVTVYEVPEITGTGWSAKLVQNEIEGVSVSMADVVDGYYTLPEDFNPAGKQLSFTVSNIPEASKNCAIRINFVYESGIKTQNVADTGTVYLKDQLRLVGTAAFKADEQISSTYANGTRFVLTVAGESYYYLVWDYDAGAYLFKNSTDSGKYIVPAIVFVNDAGKVAPGLNDIGSLLNEIKGTLYVAYGYTASEDVTVAVPIDFSKYELTKPTKTEYIVGEDFDKTGLVVTATANGVTKTLVENADYTLDTSTYDKTQAGTYTIKVTSTDGTVLASFTVAVGEAKVKGVLTTNGDTLAALTQGYGFSADGLEVKFTAEGETTARVLTSSEYEIDSSAYRDAVGQYTIVVKLVANPEITASYTVTVVEDW